MSINKTTIYNTRILNSETVSAACNKKCDVLLHLLDVCKSSVAVVLVATRHQSSKFVVHSICQSPKFVPAAAFLVSTTLNTFPTSSFNRNNNSAAMPDEGAIGAEDWMWGMAINLVGSVLINVGTNLVKYYYTLNTRRASMCSITDPTATTTAPARISRHGNQVKLWWLGTLVFVIGNLMNFVSMSFAPLSLLAALGSVQFLSNLFFSVIILKTKVCGEMLQTVC